MREQVRKFKKISRFFLARLKNYMFFSRMKKIKFNVGSAGINNDKSWYATDIQTLDLTKENDWKNLLFNLRLDNIMAEHVWEHLTAEDTILANKHCYKYLKKGGSLRIAVPDGFNPDKQYIDYVKPGGHGAGADDHKILYNYKTLRERLQNAGFKIQLLEYWDEFGNYHFIDWTDDGGHISRSRRYDSRNKDNKLCYTSLIVDAIKL